VDVSKRITAADALESDWILDWEEEMAERRARKAARRKKKKQQQQKMPAQRDWG